MPVRAGSFASPFNDTGIVWTLGCGLAPSISSTAVRIRDAAVLERLRDRFRTRFTFDRSACEEANITTKKANIKVMKSA